MSFIFIHIFAHSLKNILWDSSILCYYTILYTNISWWWMIGLFGFMVLLLVAVSRNFLILCFLYFFETSIEPRKFRLSFSFWLLLTLSKLWKKHQTKSKTYSTSTMTLSLKKIFFYKKLKNKPILLRKKGFLVPKDNLGRDSRGLFDPLSDWKFRETAPCSFFY